MTMAEAGPEHFAEGIAGKLTSQINLVLRGVPHVSDGGSFTVVTGILGQHGTTTVFGGEDLNSDGRVG